MRAIVVGFLLALVASPASGQNSAWLRQTVMSRVPNPQFVQFVDGKWAPIELKGIYWVAIAETGDALGVQGLDGRQGWLPKKDALNQNDAFAYYSELIGKNPKDAWALSCRGVVRLAHGGYDEAAKDLTEAIQLEPKNAGIWTWRGIVWNHKLDYDKALLDFEGAIKLDANHGEAFVGRGYVWAQKKDHERAIKDYSEAIRISPNDILAHRYRGVSWLQIKEYEKSISDLDKSMLLEGPNADNCSYRGRAFLGLNKFGQAIKDFDLAIVLDPKDANAVAWRGYSWWRQNDFDHALTDFEKALQIDPTNIFARNYRGKVRVKKRDYAGAIKDFDEGIRIHPKFSGAMASKAHLLATCPDGAFRDGPKALDLAKQACELTNWKDGWVFASLAAAHAQLGQFDQAIKWQKKAMEDSQYLRNDDEKTLAKRILATYEKKLPWREP